MTDQKGDGMTPAGVRNRFNEYVLMALKGGAVAKVCTVTVSGIMWTEGGGIYCDVTTSDGRSGFLCALLDGRITRYRERAHVQWGSATMEWCDWLIQAIVPQLQEWLAGQKAANPALRGMRV